jgi:hypothetical protein
MQEIQNAKNRTGEKKSNLPAAGTCDRRSRRRRRSCASEQTNVRAPRQQQALVHALRARYK